jgi:2-methylisocitrate lyase-like PEP mutase family enzyme
MELAGAEVAFVGTSGVIGTYTGLSDVGMATMTECLTIAGWIAQSVHFPIIVDGDTGHGGIMAVRRLIAEAIRAGLAGIRIDDQPIEGKRSTQDAGVEVVPLEQAIVRYRAAVDMKNGFCRNFSLGAICSMFSLHDQRCIMRENDDGDQLQGSPFSPGYHADGCTLVGGLSVELSACRRTDGRTWG